MNDTDNAICSSYERHRQARAKISKGNRRAVFAVLAAANITQVQVEFDGEGDSGQIDSVTAFRGEERAQLPETKVRVRNVSLGDAKPETMESTLGEAIETLCYDCLEETHDGWENNEGAYGEFRFDVANQRIELEFNGRFTDVSTSKHTWRR